MLDPFATGILVAIAAVLASHVNVRVFLILLASFAVLWIIVARLGAGGHSLGLALLFFIIASGLIVAAGVHIVRMLFQDRALSRLQITCAAVVGSLLATFFLVTVFSR